MSAADLTREYRAAVLAVEQRHTDRMAALGVSYETMDDMSPDGWMPFGVATIIPDDEGLFEPGAGALHVVQPIYAGEDIIDMVAWTSADPASWRLRTGLGAWLGDLDALIDCAIDAPVSLYATPLDWLRAGGDGLCIVNWSAPELDQLLRLQSISAPDAGIAEALRRALVRPASLPEITVAGEMRRAA
jgi:hypothetical protein